MGNYRVAWALLFSYVALLGLSTTGIGVSFLLPKHEKPLPPEENVTIPTTPAPLQTTESYSFYDHYDRYGNREQPSKELQAYGNASIIFASYEGSIQSYLIFPCGLNILLVVPLILGGLCSRKIFSSSVALYSSVALWVVDIVHLIIFQNDYNHLNIGKDIYTFVLIFGIQLGMLAIISFQIILAIWEMQRQKMNWPVLRFSHLMTFNTLFLIGRIVLGSYLLRMYYMSRMWEGFKDPEYEKFYFNYWTIPRIKYPEYYAYPVGLTILYGIVTPCESLASHLLGHLHTKMMSLTTFMSTLFYGGMIMVSSPAFITVVIAPVKIIYPDLMNMAIGAMFLSLIHTIGSVVKSEAMRTPPAFLTSLINEVEPTVGYNESIRNGAATLRRKFKGSDGLLYNTIVLVFSGVALILASFEAWLWPGVVMLCGNALVVSRILPSVVMEAVTQKEERVPVLKMLMHVFLECSLLIIGMAGSFYQAYGTLIPAILLNICLVILLVGKLSQNPALRAAATSLSTNQSEQQSEERLINESQDETGGPLQDQEEESNGIYQPVA